MADSKITKQRFPEFLAAVSGDHAVYGPREAAGNIAFGIGCGKEVARSIVAVNTLSGSRGIPFCFTAKIVIGECGCMLFGISYRNQIIVKVINIGGKYVGGFSNR